MKSFLLSDNYRMAIESIRAARVRSFLTMLGIIIGVVSVVTTVSLGEGVKNQVEGQINKLGTEIITVQPGNLVNRDEDGSITSVNLFSTLGRGSLSDDDLKAVRSSENIKQAIPLSLITGSPEIGDRSFGRGTIIATTENFPEVINHELEYGSFFSDDDLNKNTAIIGRNVAISFFEENVPIGKAMQIRGQEFVVNGVFERFGSNPTNPTLDMNNAIFIPYETGKKLADDTAHIFQILAETNDPADAETSVNSIVSNLEESRGGEDDFTVLKQEETLAIAQNVVGMVTSLVAAVAAVSLLIGGIGIMNIMLVSVSERTREIGIRKAIGATNRQIRAQFLIEAIVLSVWGALVGLFVSVLINIGLLIFTDLQPAITWQIMVISTFVAVIVGIVFGIAPAVKASLKDPIESLRSF
jgi:putative ABC transport system permease protein